MSSDYLSNSMEHSSYWEAYSSSAPEEIPFILRQPKVHFLFHSKPKNLSHPEPDESNCKLFYFFKNGIMEIYFCLPTNYPTRLVWFWPQSMPEFWNFSSWPPFDLQKYPRILTFFLT